MIAESQSTAFDYAATARKDGPRLHIKALTAIRPQRIEKKMLKGM